MSYKRVDATTYPSPRRSYAPRAAKDGSFGYEMEIVTHIDSGLTRVPHPTVERLSVMEKVLSGRLRGVLGELLSPFLGRQH
jgi:hypothetical protein